MMIQDDLHNLEKAPTYNVDSSATQTMHVNGMVDRLKKLSTPWTTKLCISQWKE